MYTLRKITKAGVEMNFNLGDINLTLPPGSDPQKAGIDLVDAVEKRAREALQKNMLIQGAQ